MCKCTCKPSPTIKVGDKVKIVRKVESHSEGWENSWVDSMDKFVGSSGLVVVVLGTSVYIKGCENWAFPLCGVELISKKQEPHKHAELIKAWADGAQIQHKNIYNNWVDIDPLWLDEVDYRIKPEPKPDIVYIHSHKKFGVGVIRSKYIMDTQRIKWTIDGESGRIKSVELLDK